MSKKTSDKMSFFGSDNVESPKEIIDADKDTDRKAAFKDAYKRNMQIIPGYFTKKKPKGSTSESSGGKSFTQNIIVTQEGVNLETNKNVEIELDEEKERED